MRSFGTTRKEILSLAAWLRGCQATKVVMEATSDYWRIWLRREAPCCIPGAAGKDWRDVLGSDVLPGAERLRGQEHDRKPAAGSRYQGRRAGGPARYGES